MEKNELLFALLSIFAYITANSLGTGISNILGIKSCATAVFNLGVSLFLIFWIKKNGLMERYGLCKTALPTRNFLWYIPLVILASSNLWNGAEMTLPVADTVFSICNMIGVGFLEELLFRGFLYRAVSRNSAKRGILISSVSFGLGHIVNLFNGRGMEITENLWQIVFAAAFGFMCTMIFCQGKTLWPCILTHSAINVASVFSKEMAGTDSGQILQNTIILLLIFGYTYTVAKIIQPWKSRPRITAHHGLH